MNLLKLALTLTFLASLNSYSQSEYKVDKRPQNQKEHNLSDVEDISLSDMMEILEFQGIKINKFKLGKFDKPYNISLIADEYLNGKLISSDTIVNTSNTYIHFKSEKPFYDFIDQITIITKNIPGEKKSQLLIKTYGFSMSRLMNMKNVEKENSLNWVKYTDTKWQLNKKIPLLIYASSWLDEKYNIRRFCGVNTLIEGDKDTIELLNSSRNYVKISYLVSE